MTNYFPLGLALSQAFCNRAQEKKRLLTNIKTATPTLISSTRRYGKTSLVIETLRQKKINYVQIDLFAATSIEDVLTTILNGIGQAIMFVQPNLNKALQLALDFFSSIQIKVELGKTGINLSLPKSTHNHVSEINDALSKLELLLKKYGKKIVLFFDEFQTIGQIRANFSIEATIRAHVQMPSNIIYIFSGSNRHLLSQMFDDRNRPFYKLCDQLTLNKIAAHDYDVFINHAAKEKWGEQLPQSVLDEILTLTNRHPFYVNALCFKVWQDNNKPSQKRIQECWNLLAQEQKPYIAIETDLLSLNQKRLLSSLAKWGKNQAIQSKEFIKFTGMASSSLYQALDVLLKKDFIEEDEDGTYKIIDPMLEFLFRS